MENSKTAVMKPTGKGEFYAFFESSDLIPTYAFG